MNKVLKGEWQWTDELVKEMIYAKLVIPDHYLGKVQKCLDEFKESRTQRQPTNEVSMDEQPTDDRK